MIGDSISPSVLHSNLVAPISRNSGLNLLPSFWLRPKKSCSCPRIRVTSEDNAENTPQPLTSSGKKNPLAVVLDVPRSIWRQTLVPLRDFGFGKRSIWEGGVGLFLVSSAFLLALCLVWVRGFRLSSKFRKYLAVFEFAQACGISTGTAVRIRGVTVGSVIRVNPSLRSIEAVVEVEDENIIIPKNSLVEVNQSGLLMETMIDITPRDPIPRPGVGPLHAECVKEGLIVCDKQRIKGSQGVSLDALIGIFTRLGSDVEAIGVANTDEIAVRAASIIEEARALLTNVFLHILYISFSVDANWSTTNFDQILSCLMSCPQYII